MKMALHFGLVVSDLLGVNVVQMYISSANFFLGEIVVNE